MSLSQVEERASYDRVVRDFELVPVFEYQDCIRLIRYRLRRSLRYLCLSRIVGIGWFRSAAHSGAAAVKHSWAALISGIHCVVRGCLSRIVVVIVRIIGKPIDRAAPRNQRLIAVTM